MKVSEEQLQGLIFDVDGTLYHQKPVRLQMALKLGTYYLFHLARWRELYGIFLLRRLREKTNWLSKQQQLKQTAEKAGISPEALENAIQKWMFEVPLPIIATHRNKECLALLRKMQEAGKQIIIYSDYPAEEKLEALNVHPDRLFYPECCESCFSQQKPSREAMEYILEQIHLRPEQLLLIGDREEKDGSSAKLVNMAFLNVKNIGKGDIYEEI